jgi:hypothetical protein
VIGQWFGFVNGTNRGVVTLNFETDITDINGMIGGRAMFMAHGEGHVNFYCIIKCKIVDGRIEGTLHDFFFYDYSKHLLMNYVDFKTYYPDSGIPKEGMFKGELKNNTIGGSWKTDVGTQGTFIVSRSKIDEEKTADYSKTWDSFREWVAKNSDGDRAIIYRGQRNPRHRLQTTFHRTGRNDIIRYAQTDINILAHHINAISNYKYDLSKKDDFYAILNLSQHHGYPTPLLDWTESPYVAAYFAYRNVEKKEDAGQVRIFSLNTTAWIQRCRPVESLLDPSPSITVSVLPAINNNRAIPQQSVSTLSNINDMEGFIELHESTFHEKYLTRIDLPISDRNKAMKELQSMGITAASLFPGFDGVCDYLKERYF